MSTGHRYEADIPAEPPVGTVVLDKDGLAWQRVDMNDSYPCWVVAQIRYERSNATYWPKLLLDAGPLIELYRPESEVPE